jgi:pyruvate dehydrogenase E2 component (dihydrolipoamide acetyltransferase)
VAVVRGAPAAAAAAAAPAAPAAAKAGPRTPQTPPGVESEDAFGKTRREKFSRIRKTIAANMSRSASTIPHVTNFDEADITELDEIRTESAADYQGVSIKLTMMPFIMKSVAHALKLHPLLNAQIDTESDEIVYKDYVNLGVAVDTPRGLVVPVVKGVDHMTIPQIAHAMSKVSENARTNQFALEDLRGGSFTISNLGAVGGIYSTPIINHPEVAILLVGRSRKLPVVVGDEVKIRLMMPLSLSYDHRLIDGATAARFLNEVISLLHAPGRLLLSPLAG